MVHDSYWLCDDAVFISFFCSPTLCQLEIILKQLYNLYLIIGVNAAKHCLEGLSVISRGMRRRGEVPPRGGYSSAGYYMAKGAETLEDVGPLPRAVWRTSADTALYSRGHTSSFWLRFRRLSSETSFTSLMHVNSIQFLFSSVYLHSTKSQQKLS